MIEVAAMQKLQDRWPEEFSSTSARRFRDGDDVQYAFAYFHFLMEGGAREGLDVREYFDRELDVDADRVLSANELRTLGSIVMQHSPSDADVARLRDCLAPERVESSVERTEEFGEEAVEVRRRTSRPLITWSRLMECDEVVTGLSKHARFGATHQDMPHDEVSFEMLQDDFNKSSALLDGIRAKRTKFICINDDMKEAPPATRRLLRDFYESYFPLRCPVELPEGVSNPYLHTGPLRQYVAVKVLRSFQSTLLACAAAAVALTAALAWWWCGRSAASREEGDKVH